MSHQPKSNNNSSGNNSRLKRDDTIKNINENLSDSKVKKVSQFEGQTYFEKKFQENNYIGGTNYVYTFGSNEMGQLGQEVEMNSPFSFNPILLNSLTPHKIISISAGDGHTVCVSKDGTVFAWGASACGQLGLDENETMPRDSEGYPFQPTPIPVKLMNGIKIKEVACGDAHTLAMTTEGRVFSWGGAGCGQLGHPNIGEMPKDADNCPYQPYPRIIETLKSLTMVHIACGKAHSLSIDSTGCLFTWGAGACGQLGVEDIHTLPVDDDGYPYQPVPKYLKSLKGQNIILGVCGDVHTLALNDKGEVFSFGGGSFGQLGLGTINKMPLDSDRYPYMPIPTKIDSLNDIHIVNIACGDSHSMAIDSEGRLYGWGAAACGQLGFDTLVHLPKDGEGNPYQPEPKLVTFFENIKVLTVSCGEAHTLALIEGGVIYSFGGSTCGQLGYPEVKELKAGSKSIPKSLQSRVNEMLSFKYEKPRLISSLLGKNIYKMACGGVHNIILADSQPVLSSCLYSMMKSETMTDIEIIIENNSQSIKCHKYILISKSNYFYTKLIKEQPKNSDKFIFQTTVKFSTLKSIIEYLYLDDISFINNLEVNSTSNLVDTLLEYLKLAKLLDLKALHCEVESKIKLSLSKYSEAISNMNTTFLTSSDNNLEENEESINVNKNSSENQFKGLFFLPNGNCMLLLNEELIENILKNSVMINFNTNSALPVATNTFSTGKILSQKNIQDNQSNIKGVNKYTKSNTTSKIKESSKSSSQMLVDSEDLSTNTITLNNNLNKTISNFGFSSKNLFEAFYGTEEFDIYEILYKFNLIENDSNLSSNNNFDLLKYFNKPEASDIVIKVEEKVFYGHRAILSCSSKYFEMMLSENMKENSKGEVIIPDYTAEEFLYLMLFFYSENLVLDLEKALELLKGADMFAVDNLKFKLENFLSSKLEIENAAKIFKFASFYNYERLKKICLAFILDNYKQVIETSEFEDLHRESMLEIIRFCKSR